MPFTRYVFHQGTCVGCALHNVLNWSLNLNKAYFTTLNKKIICFKTILEVSLDHSSALFGSFPFSY